MMYILSGKEGEMGNARMLGLIAWLCLCLMDSAKGGQVNWSLPFSSGHVLADGVTKIPHGTVFQLGTFTQGFIPSSQNQATWAGNWYAADFAFHQVIDDQYQGFGGDYNAEVSTVPLTTGTQLYVWGIHLKADGSSEQWLGTATSWQVPTTNPLAFPIFIDIDEASNVILGSSKSSNDTIAMASASASIPLPKINGEAWRRNFFSVTEIATNSVGHWDADPDADGVTNVVEFFLGTDPLVHSMQMNPRLVDSSSGFLLRCTAWKFPSLTIQVAESQDLSESWAVLGNATYDDATNSWTYPISLNLPRNFFRFQWEKPSYP